jgi:SAM-dependent methyltransferase
LAGLQVITRDTARAFLLSFFERLGKQHGIGVSGQRILDLGTGTGALARGLAQAGADVVGLDVTKNQLDAGRELDRAAGVQVEYIIGRAEATGLADNSFDIVIAGQCWHWFDGAAVAAEARRLLKPMGRLVICSFDWIPLPGNVVEATEQLIQRHNPEWRMGGGSGIYPNWTVDAGCTGFSNFEIFGYDHTQHMSHEAWRGRIRASAGVGASLNPAQVERFDADLTEILRIRFPEHPLVVPHRVFALVANRGLGK